MIIYNTTTSAYESYSGGSWSTLGSGGGGGALPVLPDPTATPTLADWTALLTAYTRNVNTKVRTGSVSHSTVVANAYSGAVYSPNQNRIYFVPYYQGASGETNWHYIDCNTGQTVAYAHGSSVVSSAYVGGVYSPVEDRIYLIPNGMGPQGTWYYIDCATGDIVGYSHGASVQSFGYAGGVYSPTQNRIYFVPASAQASQTNWHYISCTNAANYGVVTVTAYAHGTSGTKTYAGGVYSPSQNRIYFVPNQSGATNANWHYVDCATGNIVAYAHGATTTTGQIYYGGAYSPTQNRIYFAPKAQQDQANWHYVDCATGNIVAYAHGLATVYYEYKGAVYHPTLNRIYFMPESQRVGTSSGKYDYVNCTTGAIASYPKIFKRDGTAHAEGVAFGGAYSPTEDRIYFSPGIVSDYELWYYIAGSGVTDNMCPSLFGSTLLSSTL